MKILVHDNGVMTMEAENQAEQFQLQNLKLALPFGHCAGTNGRDRICYTFITSKIPVWPTDCAEETQ